ncbi:hypothetical protein CP061683_0132B, partial [Chlamydia psittaci 06-1683]
FYSIFL